MQPHDRCPAAAAVARAGDTIVIDEGATAVCLSRDPLRDPLRRRIGDVLALPWADGVAEPGITGP